MQATQEQKTIIDHMVAHDGLRMVSAVAGSGKTTLLVAVAKALEKKCGAKSGLYLAYNKSVATEAKKRFPDYVHCCTTHSLAYNPTVVQMKLKLGLFTYRNVTEKITYESKCKLVDQIKEFCLSRHTSFADFAEEFDLSEKRVELANKYLSLMQSGKIECTHEFYLKLFHILLSTKAIEYEVFDFVALDEAGDLNPVTLEIFNLLTSKKSMMVGDPDQNIYQFNHTINCFEVMEGKGVILPMTQSFRVSKYIANSIQDFCNTYLNPVMRFKGITIEDKTITTRAFISRTNAALISEMIRLNKLNIQYRLTRTAKQIFQLPLMLCGLKYKGFITLPEYKPMQEEVNYYYENADIRSTYSSVLAYIKSLYEDDIALQNALKLLLRHGSKAIIDCYEEARKHEQGPQNYILGTAHSMKGLEFDKVEIADDLNSTIEPIILTMDAGLEPYNLTAEQRGELNLYYVACSRAKKELINAKFL